MVSTTSLHDEGPGEIELVVHPTREAATRSVSTTIATTAEEPHGLVMPEPPNDAEKVSYLRSGRWYFIATSLLSTCSLTAGMILFTRANPAFYWFGPFVMFFAIYLLVSLLAIGVWGKDFDYEWHLALRQKHRDYAPSVDVYLPVCGEDIAVLANTWKFVALLDYPRVSVHVLDDGDSREVEALAATHGFNYILRDNRPELKKAGNLRYAFARTDGDIIVIFDADFCPRTEFLREVLPHFVEDPTIAIVQTPQYFRVRGEQTWVERGAGIVQELFYRLIQVNRNRFGASICVGTCGVYRRIALNPFGGTAPIGYSEDVHTGFSVLSTGWRVVYVPICLAMGMCPDTQFAFFMQQYRWAMGSTTLLLNPEFWNSSLTRIQKMAYLTGMMYYSATALGIFLNPLPGLLLIWVVPSAVAWFNVAFAVPSILLASIVMPLWSRQRYGFEAGQVKVIQNFSHLWAIKDKLASTALEWVPTGGAARGSKNAKFVKARQLAGVWTFATTTATIVGAALRISQGYWWLMFIPTVFLSVMNLVQHLNFIFGRV